MRFNDLLKRSWKNVLKNKVRFILTSLSLAVGAFTISLTLAITSAASDTFSKSLGTNIQKDAILVVGKGEGAGALQTEEEQQNSSNNYQNTLLKDTDVEKIRAISAVTSVEPIYKTNVNALVIGGKHFSTYAVSPLTLQEQPQLMKGERQDIGSSGIFLPESFIEKAGLSPGAAIGQKVQVGREESDYSSGKKTLISVDTTIQGVIKSNDNPVFDEAFFSVKANNELAKKIATNEKEQGIGDGQLAYNVINTRAHSENEEDVKAAISALEAAGYKVYSIAQINQKFLDQVNIIRLFLLGIGGIAILAAVFGVINTQYMTVYERTREIGIMKALGMSRGGVLGLFSLEAVWIGVAGSVIGIVLSIPMIIWLNALASGGGSTAPGATLTPINVLIVVASLGIIALVAGLLPARRAAKLDPIEALRTE